MARAGRKRKTIYQREPNGRIQRPTTTKGRSDAIMQTVLDQRIKGGATRQNATDQRWGFALGRLRMQGQISQRQYDAGEIWTRRAVAYYGVVVGSLPRFPSALANLIGSGGMSTGATPDDDTVDAIRERFAEIQSALADVGRHIDGNRALTRLCILDRAPDNDHWLGVTREALNAIANRMRLPLPPGETPPA